MKTNHSLKCRKCNQQIDEDTDSAKTIRVIGLCEDCMTQQDWDNYNVKIDLEQGYEPIEFSTDKNIRMLEQLNRTLELLQSNRQVDAAIPDRPTIRQKVEESVLECIAMLCTPLIASKETPSA